MRTLQKQKPPFTNLRHRHRNPFNRGTLAPDGGANKVDFRENSPLWAATLRNLLAIGAGSGPVSRHRCTRAGAMASKSAILRQMMRPYEGPRHRVVALGQSGAGQEVVASGQPIAGVDWEDHLFEIGSITKVFTATLLSVMAEAGEVDPKAPLAEIDPALSVVPPWITPERLATHSSGLPRLHKPIWRVILKPLPDDPYADFSRADLLDWFDNWRGRVPGTPPRHAYSNIGMGLLGEALSMRCGTPYPELLAERVLSPLGLSDTVTYLSEAQRNRFSQPHDPKGRPVVPWTFQAIAGAGCLRSTPRDLARFAAHVCRAVRAPQSALDRALKEATAPRLGLGSKGAMEPRAQCLGWFADRSAPDAPRIVHHNGGTAGSTSALYLCPEREEAIVLLCNNGVIANLWAGMKLERTNPLKQAERYFGVGQRSE